MEQPVPGTMMKYGDLEGFLGKKHFGDLFGLSSSPAF